MEDRPDRGIGGVEVKLIPVPKLPELFSESIWKDAIEVSSKNKACLFWSACR